jgi:hypothetical protein
MKRLLSLVLLTASTLMSACSYLPLGAGTTSAADRTAGTSKATGNAVLPPGQVRIQDEAGSAVVQKVEFKSGVSSATVERLAKSQGCTGRAGAGLMTEKGPVEIYRMQCDNGTAFVAQCELRQCRPMR